MVYKDYLDNSNDNKKSLNQLVYNESQNRIKQIMNKKNNSSFFFIDNNQESIMKTNNSNLDVSISKIEDKQTDNK